MQELASKNPEPSAGHYADIKPLIGYPGTGGQERNALLQSTKPVRARVGVWLQGSCVFWMQQGICAYETVATT